MFTISRIKLPYLGTTILVERQKIWTINQNVTTLYGDTWLDLNYLHPTCFVYCEKHKTSHDYSFVLSCAVIFLFFHGFNY